jgi:hypothetical protein
MDGSDAERRRAHQLLRESTRGTLGEAFSQSVVLSEAKDLIAACNRDEILRFAQDDTSVPSTLAGVPRLGEMSGYATKP